MQPPPAVLAARALLLALLLAVTAHAQHSICLSFISSDPSQEMATLEACTRLAPALHAASVDWIQTYCGTTPPDFVPIPVQSSGSLIYTCSSWSATSRFTPQIARLWNSAYPNLSPTFRINVEDSFSGSLPTINLFILTTSARLPGGSAYAKTNWFPVVTAESFAISPPPPMAGGLTLYHPPPPRPPPAPRGGECNSISSLVGADPMRVSGLVLCAGKSYDQRNWQYNATVCRINVTLTLINVGVTLIPEAGLAVRFGLQLGGAELLGWGPGLFNVLQAVNSTAVFNVGKGIPRDPGSSMQTITMPFTLQCSNFPVSVDNLPQACGCAAALRLQQAAGGADSFTCSGLVSRQNGSDQCFSTPTPSGSPPKALSRALRAFPLRQFFASRRVRAFVEPSLPPQPQCNFTAAFTVKNLGQAAVSSILGPLLVDLGFTDGRLVLGAGEPGADNVTVDAGPGSSSFHITDFGSPMQPAASSSFRLRFAFAGACSEIAAPAAWSALMQVIRFADVPAVQVTNVEDISDTAGRHVLSPGQSGSSFNDGHGVDGSSVCVFPQAILMGYSRRPAMHPTSYIYVDYPSQLGSLPSIHGQPPPGLLENSPDFSAAALFSAPRSPLATGDLAGWRIYKVVAYVMNVTGDPDDFVCGMDLSAVKAAALRVAGPTLGSNYTTFHLGCSPVNDPALIPLVTRVPLSSPPPDAFLGWFSGAVSTDTQGPRISNLQAVWVSCTA